MVDEIKRLANKEQHHSLTFAETVELLKVKKELSKVRSWIDIVWHQRAKRHWIQEGNCNTKFFHKVATTKENTMPFTALRWMETSTLSLLQLMMRLFSFMLTFMAMKYHQSQPFREGIVYDSINLDEALELEKDFSEGEVMHI